MRRIFRSVVIFFLFAVYGNADDIDLEVHSGLVLKMLRDMAKKTNASESLNLPANASSIRENITDTFSCENKTYGYYADVDNECQIFHVCLPSQTPSGRSVTYKWSFICPNETIFNQEVLVCTRPRDSIPCEDSPDYYHLNMEIGKVSNDTKSDSKPEPKPEDAATTTTRNKNERNQFQKRKPERKQNIIIDALFKEVIDKEMKDKLQDVDFENVDEIFPDIIADVEEEKDQEVTENKEVAETDEDVERLAMERSAGDNLKRASFRFRADV